MAKRTKESVGVLPGTQITVLAGLTPLLVPIDSVKLDPNNPRRQLDLSALVGSIKRFGVRKPIVVNSRDKIIEAGHQMWAALKELGAQHIPVVWANDDRVDATAFNIADNRTAEIVAEWDDHTLAVLLKDLQDQGSSSLGIGYTDEQIGRIIDVAMPGDVPNFAPDEQAAQGDIGKVKPAKVLCPKCGFCFAPSFAKKEDTDGKAGA